MLVSPTPSEISGYATTEIVSGGFGNIEETLEPHALADKGEVSSLRRDLPEVHQEAILTAAEMQVRGLE